MTKLDTFLVANGWTQDEFNTTTNRSAYTRTGGGDTCSVQFYWDGVAALAYFQSTSHDGSAPGSNPNDSGNTASPSGTLTTGSLAYLASNGPFTSYHFFESDFYFHVALESSSGVWTYFGAGVCTKIGTWTGGAYSFGMKHNNGFNIPNSEGHSFICDALASTANAIHSSFIHMEGMPGQGGSGKWGVFCKGTDGTGNDTAAVAREVVHGGSRTGPYTHAFMDYPVSLAQGFVPMWPIPVWHIRKDTTPDIITPLGEIPDIRVLNIKHFSDAQEVVIGADTWIVFPMRNKSDTVGSVSVPQTGYAGYAFKKVTT